MPRKKRKPTEWTTEEAEHKLFPKKVVDEIHRLVQEQGSDEVEQTSQSDDSED